MSQETTTDAAPAAAQPEAPGSEAPRPETPRPDTDQAGILKTLRTENEGLKARIQELTDARCDRDALRELLASAERESEDLRRRYTDLAITHATDEAAASLGISPEVAAICRSRFRCEIDADGRPRIEPDPKETLAKELENDPLLRESVDRGRQNRRAAAVASGATALAEADPVELMTALDRNPARKAQFIRRHGAQAFIDLAGAAGRRGYRG